MGDARPGSAAAFGKVWKVGKVGIPLLSLLLAAPAAFPATPPNVLFIVVDDLNDWIGVLGGHPQAKTPNIDRLAQRGVLFERAFTASPECNPSRTAVLTGIRPATSGVHRNADPWREALPGAVTLPRLFKDHGYRVLGAGKIFHGGFPDPPSWHEYFEREPNPRPAKAPRSGIPNARDFDWGPIHVEDEAMSDHRVASWAISQLGRPHESPFFLAVGLFRPHLPWYVPKSYFTPFRPRTLEPPPILESDLDDVPPAGWALAQPRRDHRLVVESDNQLRAVRGYLASVAFADAQIGRLLDALDASPHAGNTIVVLWSDHGFHLGEKRHWRKATLWEEATRVPLIIAAPGVTRPGGRSARTVSLLDLYPTLADLAGLPVSDRLEGVSLRPLLESPNAPWDRPALTTRGRAHAVRSERWRYIRYEDGSEELYDHASDPHEWRNRAADPELASVKRELRRWMPEEPQQPAGPSPAD